MGFILTAKALRVFEKELLGVEHLGILSSLEVAHRVQYSWFLRVVFQTEPGSFRGEGITPFVCSWILTRQQRGWGKFSEHPS